ncbi:condensation domain-containing protein [Actinomadura sp. LOL_016]|uniref:condensation domain-containing protein n=1 Tax=unclassified Actinomadura TaxID=2626254 RepID=UPI003A81131D
MSDVTLRSARPEPRPADPDGGEGDRIPLSLQQEFLRMVDKGDEAGPFGPQYTIVGGWRVEGELDVPTLRDALHDVVVRHEALRMTVVRDGDEQHQRLWPATPPDLRVRDLPADPAHRDAVAEEFLNEVEAGLFGADERPLIRAALGRFDAGDALLVLLAHHTLVDGWSIHVVMRDLAVCYAARREGRAPELPAVRQYRDYVAWQRANADEPGVAISREYWRETLDGARLLPLRTDRARGSQGSDATGWYRFLLDEEFDPALRRVAAETRSSPFMVLLAAYLLYLRERTGRTDIVLPTFMPGRGEPWSHELVGFFYNFIPLRTDIAGCAGFRDVIARVRATCLAAYANELPSVQFMDEAPELMDSVSDPRTAAVVFQVTQSPHMMYGERIGDLTYTAVRRRVVSAPVGSEIPDGVLWGLETHPSGGMIGSIGYTTELFDEKTVAGMAADFQRVLRENLLGR